MPFEPGNQHAKGPRKSNRAAGMAREQTEKAIMVLIEALADEKTETRIKAAETLLSRGWGKPQEYIELSGDSDSPLSVLVKYVGRNTDPGSV